MKIDSHDIKEALLHYFRHKRGWVCADEVFSGQFLGDIVADSGKWTIEVEIKMSKSDLIYGEKRKTTNWGKGINKHADWRNGRANKFALCVPEDLQECAEEWIDKTNKKYGLYIYKKTLWIQENIFTKKIARLLHSEYNEKKYLKRIARRLSSCRAFELTEINQRKKREN